MTCQQLLARVFVGVQVGGWLHLGKTVRLVYMLAQTPLLLFAQTRLLVGENAGVCHARPVYGDTHRKIGC